ncbi:hypothetical protein HK104_004634 [Borealophlyctis nickersoniae]|nr:hypothetical protein HK104_004634 [Borealophlyctis nickersoniae]
MWKKKEINVSSASVIDLKAELFKHQTAFSSHSAHSPSSSSSTSTTTTDPYTLHPSALHKRLPKLPKPQQPPKNRGVDARAARDEKDANKEEEEEEGIQKKLQLSWIALQRKANVYDELVKEGGLEDDHHGEASLVDFLRKDPIPKDMAQLPGVLQDEPDDPWVEATDEFGRTRVVRGSQVEELGLRIGGGGGGETATKAAASGGGDGGGGIGELVSDDMRREMERQRWEREVMEGGDTGPLHYSAKQEIRTLGVGYYSFSQDEQARARQMAELKKMRDETAAGRQVAGRVKDKRKERLEDRRRAILERARKKKKGGGDGGGGDGEADGGGGEGGAGREPDMEVDVSAFLEEMRQQYET